MSDSTHMDSSSLRIHPHRIDHSLNLFLFFVTRSHIDRLHRSATRVAHNFLVTHNESIVDRSDFDCTQNPDHDTSHIGSWKNFVLKILDPDFKNSRLRSSLRCDPRRHLPWGLVDLRSDLTTATPSFAHNPSHPCGTLTVSPPRSGVVRGTNHCPRFQTQESLSTGLTPCVPGLCFYYIINFLCVMICVLWSFIVIINLILIIIM